MSLLASEVEDFPTTPPLKRMCAEIGYAAPLFYVVSARLNLRVTYISKQCIYQRLCGSLQLEIARIKCLLEQTAEVCMDESLRRSAKGSRQ